MKFYKEDRIKMGGTAVITALICTASTFFSNTGNLLGFTSSFANSQKISWKDAQDLRTEYRNFKPLKVIYDDDPNHPGQTFTNILEGFKFNASDLREIIDNNLNSSNGKADEVLFYLGKKGEFGGVLGVGSHAKMHIIAVGIKNNRLLIPTDTNEQTNALRSSIYDKADPCPPHCPTQ